MRNVIFVILALLLAFSPNSLCASDEDSDLLRFSLEGATFEEALEELSKASGVEVLAQGIRPEARINLDLTDLTLDQALKEVVKVFGVENYARYTRAGAVNIWVLHTGSPPAPEAVVRAPAPRLPEVGELKQLTDEQFIQLAKYSPDYESGEPVPLTDEQMEQLREQSSEEEPGELQPLTEEQMERLRMHSHEEEPGQLQPLTEEQMESLRLQSPEEESGELRPLSPEQMKRLQELEEGLM